jgi:hypothetical protein
MEKLPTWKLDVSDVGSRHLRIAGNTAEAQVIPIIICSPLRFLQWVLRLDKLQIVKLACDTSKTTDTNMLTGPF